MVKEMNLKELFRVIKKTILDCCYINGYIYYNWRRL